MSVRISFGRVRPTKTCQVTHAKPHRVVWIFALQVCGLNASSAGGCVSFEAKGARTEIPLYLGVVKDPESVICTSCQVSLHYSTPLGCRGKRCRRARGRGFYNANNLPFFVATNTAASNDVTVILKEEPGAKRLDHWSGAQLSEDEFPIDDSYAVPPPPPQTQKRFRFLCTLTRPKGGRPYYGKYS